MVSTNWSDTTTNSTNWSDATTNATNWENDDESAGIILLESGDYVLTENSEYLRLE
jgi:hypothetical protein